MGFPEMDLEDVPASLGLGGDVELMICCAWLTPSVITTSRRAVEKAASNPNDVRRPNDLSSAGRAGL